MELTVTDANFTEIITSAKVVLIDCWAPWCGPCRSLAPTVEQVAKDYEGKAAVAKCNVDDCENLAVELGIRSIPTLIYYKDGQEVSRTMGAVPMSTITSALDSLL